jgi:hypothetical protein
MKIIFILGVVLLKKSSTDLNGWIFSPINLHFEVYFLKYNKLAGIYVTYKMKLEKINE